MRTENGYHIDTNNNRWNANLYTAEQAQELSETLTDCTDCANCYRCIGCFDCSHCTDCIGCIGCIGCFDCSGCTDCIGCTNCTVCTHCSHCTDCIGCTDCSRCSRCSGCFGYTSNPQRYMGQPMGSRNAQTTVYWGDTEDATKLVQVVCGCFLGTLEEFEAEVQKTHGDNEHGKEYRHLIETVRTIMAR